MEGFGDGSRGVKRDNEGAGDVLSEDAPAVLGMGEVCGGLPHDEGAGDRS